MEGGTRGKQLLGTDPPRNSNFPIPLEIMLQILTTVHDLPRFHGINLLHKAISLLRTIMPLILPTTSATVSRMGDILVWGRYIRIPRRVWFRLNYLGVVRGMERFLPWFFSRCRDTGWNPLRMVTRSSWGEALRDDVCQLT